MKIHAFKVDTFENSKPLSEILFQIEQQSSLRERIRLINQIELRAESISQRNGLWLMDFVRIRTSHGPGRVGRDSEVEGFDFEPEEGFGEETAALYDPITNYMLVQYNHFGVRAGSIADYLSGYDQTDTSLYSLKPKYDEDVERRLLNQSITRKMVFTIDLSKMSAQDMQRGRSLSEALDYGRTSGADKIKVEISVQGDQQKTLARSALDALSALQLIRGQNPFAVTALEVTGKEDADSVTEVLDLIAHRLSVEIDLIPGDDLRLPREERYGALIKAKNGWHHLLGDR